MKLDVAFLHPPSIYDFRLKPVFPGPIAQTVPQSSHQFISFPVGILSMAEYLHRQGFRVKIFNIGELMMRNPELDVRGYIKNIETKIFAIDLHWIVHAHGSIEIAKICKKTHPNSLVILGGLTASYFHEQIINGTHLIDAIFRGESEKPILDLANMGPFKSFTKIENVTYSDSNNRLKVNPLGKPCKDLDDFEFVRWDLVTPSDTTIQINSSIFMKRGVSIPICRGCIFNCVTCGGSSYSYKNLHGREKPAFRSPQRIVEDLQQASKHGFEYAFLFQDPRIGGKNYYRSLFKSIKEEKPDIQYIAFELFTPANEEFIKALKELNSTTTLSISPESGSEKVRYPHGREYSNTSLIGTAKLCLKYEIPLSVFFMTGLAEDIPKNFVETSQLCKKLCQLNVAYKREKSINRDLLMPTFGPMILLDPGSLAFDNPQLYGYRLRHKDFWSHYNAMSLPSWFQWMNYETKHLDRKGILEAILNSLEFLMDLKEEYGYLAFGGLTRPPDAKMKTNINRFILRSNRFLADEIENIISIKNKLDYEEKLNTLYRLFSERNEIESISEDKYGYKKEFEKIIHQSIGIMNHAFK